MQKNISCFEVLEELYEENIDDKILRQIKFDIALLKKYLYYWQKYNLLKEIEDIFLPRRFRGNTNCGFIEDCISEDKIKELRSVAVKGTTKFVLSLVFQETKGEEETIKDMLVGSVEDFFEDKEDELDRMLLSSEDWELIKRCFGYVQKYKKKNSFPRYDIFNLPSSSLDNMKSCLLKFKIYLDDKNKHWDLDYQILESCLNRENLLEPLEEMTYRVASSDDGGVAQRNLLGISFLLAKLRMGITDSTALQTKEITKYKGRKNLLNISVKMNLNEIIEYTKKLVDELEELLSPLLESHFIRYHLYEFYFKRRGNLQMDKTKN